MSDLGIYQIVLSDQVVPYLDPGFLQLDWRANPAPHLREIAIHAHVGQSGLYRRHELTAALSAKFYAKTGLRSADVMSWVADNPGYDIYLISGYPHSPYFAFNSIERGYLFHPDFERIMRGVCRCVGMELPEKLWRQSNRNLAYSSFWIAGPGFWDAWTRDVIECLLSRERLGADLYDEVHSPVDYMAHLPGLAPRVVLAPFIYERLVSLYITMKGIRAKYYDWPREQILTLRLAEGVKECLARIMPIIDAFDEQNNWTEANMKLPSQEFKALLTRCPGPKFDVFDRIDFNLPSIPFPRA